MIYKITQKAGVWERANAVRLYTFLRGVSIDGKVTGFSLRVMSTCTGLTQRSIRTELEKLEQAGLIAVTQKTTQGTTQKTTQRKARERLVIIITSTFRGRKNDTRNDTENDTENDTDTKISEKSPENEQENTSPIICIYKSKSNYSNLNKDIINNSKLNKEQINKSTLKDKITQDNVVDIAGKVSDSNVTDDTVRKCAVKGPESTPKPLSEKIGTSIKVSPKNVLESVYRRYPTCKNYWIKNESDKLVLDELEKVGGFTRADGLELIDIIAGSITPGAFLSPDVVISAIQTMVKRINERSRKTKKWTGKRKKVDGRYVPVIEEV